MRTVRPTRTLRVLRNTNPRTATLVAIVRAALGALSVAAVVEVHGDVVVVSGNAPADLAESLESMVYGFGADPVARTGYGPTAVAAWRWRDDCRSFPVRVEEHPRGVFAEYRDGSAVIRYTNGAARFTDRG
jgi:hypothetical protein